MKNRNIVAAAATMIAGFALGVMAAPASAQLASPSTPALGMGDNFTAAARGYAAAAWNPAGLAMRGNPGFSLSLATPRGIAGLGPVTLADLSDFQDVVVPLDVRQRWLAEVQAAGGQSGTGGFDMNYLALQVGPVAVQASTTARAVSDLAPGLVQLIMFGNADAQGAPQNIDLAGSALNMHAYSSVAVSYAIPFSMGTADRLSVGVTAKYTVGHFLALGDESTGQATASPIGMNMSFPLLHSPTGDDMNANGGSGIGLDVGVGYEMGNMSFGVTVKNVLNTFAWDTDVLSYRSARMSFAQGQDFVAEFDEQPANTAPAALRQMVDDLTFKPSISAGAMMQYTRALKLTADARFGSTAGMSPQPTTHLGAGAEYRLAGFIPLRAGAAFVQQGENNSGFQFGGGVGLSLGGYNMGLSVARRSLDLGTEDVVMFSLLSFGH
jgi:hypothetical protein